MKGYFDVDCFEMFINVNNETAKDLLCQNIFSVIYLSCHKLGIVVNVLSKSLLCK